MYQVQKKNMSFVDRHSRGVRKNGHNLHKYFNEQINLNAEDKR